jgi:hypothetical protein
LDIRDLEDAGKLLENRRMLGENARELLKRGVVDAGLRKPSPISVQTDELNFRAVPRFNANLR